jgi:hypothetical protein
MYDGVFGVALGVDEVQVFMYLTIAYGKTAALYRSTW